MSIVCDHISYGYEMGTAMERVALHDICLEIPDGQFIGLIGHTGSGKSTLIQHLNGLLKASSGSIYYNWQDIYDKDYSMKELRKKVGLVFQYPEHQLFETTVLEDVKFGPKNMGLDSLEVDLRAYEALRLVGITEDMLDYSPYELSGGQKRRVAIAGVLAMEPEVLILDEPTAGLDPKGREEILGLIQMLHQTKKLTVILVSHSMEDVAEYVERIIVMNDGQVYKDGTPKEVFANADGLEEIGLSIPEATKLMLALQAEGVPVDVSATNVKEAVASIMMNIR